MKYFRVLGWIFAILLVIGIASAARWKALTTLNIDIDEDDYMRAGQQFTAIFRSGDLSGLLETNYRPEHPPLAKIILGLSFLQNPERPLTPDRPTTAGPNNYLPRDLLRTGRETNGIFSILTVALLAIVNPLGGLLLAVHAWTIKYVSQIMLEAIPAFTSIVCVLAYLRWKKKSGRRFTGWLVVSAVFLGLTAASKYLYSIVALAILADWLMEAGEEHAWKPALRTIGLWILTGVVIFLLFNPYLWPDPIGRLKESILYHAAYSAGASEVERANFPFWQQFLWLSESPLMWQRNAFYFSIDPIIAILAAFGLAGSWKKHRVFTLWLLIGLFFLLIWPTKWPQYLVTISAPLCLSAAEGINSILIAPIKGWFARRKERTKRPAVPLKSQLKQALPWLVPGLVAFLVFTLLPLIYQLGVSLTDFNSISIKDGLTGGIWREVSGGLIGQIQVALQEFPYRAKIVHYLGFSNYLPLIANLNQQKILFNNILWMVTSVGLQTLLGVLIAIILWQKGIWFKRSWQVLYILPWAIPEMIGALMWLNVFAPDTGWLSLAAQKFGAGMPFSFLLGWEKSPDMWLVILLISGVWYGFPFMMLAASAGLKMIPKESFDAAQIDGATGWQTLRYVTWPLVYPLLMPAIIIRGIFAFNQFYLFQTFGFGTGTLATMSYNFFNPSGFFINGQFAISAVINIITVIILIGFVLLFNRWSNAEKGVTYA